MAGGLTDDLGRQIFRRAAKKGIDFTLMVAGERCLGKSTLVSALFGDAATGAGGGAAPAAGASTVSVQPRTVEITESGVGVRLTIVDTPGFGDGLDASEDVAPLEAYIDGAYRQYLADESRADRSGLVDRRVHALLYFVPPAQDGLRPLDVLALQHLHTRVNVVPLIAKADTLLPRERDALKSRIRAQLEAEKIRVFVPGADPDDEQDIRAECELLAATVPFAVVGSTERHSVAGGATVRGRRYGWGVVDIDNEAHCDFSLLRKMLIKTHLQDLKGMTEEVHYERFRKEMLEKGGVVAPAVSVPAVAGETGEDDLTRRHEQMKRDLEEQARLLEEKRRQFEQEKQQFETSRSPRAAKRAP